jgi:hypothetical protein
MSTGHQTGRFEKFYIYATRETRRSEACLTAPSGPKTKKRSETPERVVRPTRPHNTTSSSGGDRQAEIVARSLVEGRLFRF